MKNMKKVLIWMVIIMLGTLLSSCSKKGKEYDYKLYNGIKLSNLEQVKEAIEDGADINKIEGVSSNESNPIILSANSKEKITEYLIEHGADVNYKDRSGISLLMSKAFNTDVHFCELLLKYGAKIDEGDKNGDTALEYALRANSKMSSENEINKLITLLLDNGAKVRPISVEVALTGSGNDDFCRYGIVKRILEKLKEDGEKADIDPILEAAILGDSDKVSQLLKDNKIKDDVKDKVLFYTAAFGKVETIKLLEDKGFDLKANDKKKNTILIIASQYGNFEMVEYLLNKGMDIEAQNKDKNRALTASVENNYYKLAEYLMSEGADRRGVLNLATENNNIDIMKLILSKEYYLNSENMGAAMITGALHNNVKALRYLVENGVDTNIEDNETNPLEEACLHGNLEAVKYLVENGADINGKKLKGEPIVTAAEYWKVDVVKYLVDNGADVNAISVYEDGSIGASALIKVVSNGNLEIVKLLIENGADVKAPDKSILKNTALIYASCEGSRNIVEYLVQKGSDIDYQNEEGQTALMYAVSKGQTDNVKVLLKYGADERLKDKNGQTALDLAKAKKRIDVIKLLEDIK